MADYEFITYELLDEGQIARIMLNRPEARNAQNRGMLVELHEAFLAAEADDEVRVVILGGMGPMFSAGHDMGSKKSLEELTPRPQPARHPRHQRRHPPRRREPDVAGVALLLREHPPVARPA